MKSNAVSSLWAAKRAAIRGMAPSGSSILTTCAVTCTGLSPLRRSMKVISIGVSAGSLELVWIKIPERLMLHVTPSTHSCCPAARNRTGALRLVRAARAESENPMSGRGGSDI